MRGLLPSLFIAFGCLSGCAHRQERGIPADALIARAHVARDPETTDRARWVVSFVNAQVGKRYCWGGTGPACFDCSGLAQTAWGAAGVRVPRTADDVARKLPEIALADVRPGDILWWPGHVGIYVGAGWVIDALDSEHGVVRRPAASPQRAFRPIDELEGQARFGTLSPR